MAAALLSGKRRSLWYVGFELGAAPLRRGILSYLGCLGQLGFLRSEAVFGIPCGAWLRHPGCCLPRGRAASPSVESMLGVYPKGDA